MTTPSPRDPRDLCPVLVARPAGGTRPCRRALAASGVACEAHTTRTTTIGPFEGLSYRQLDYWTRSGYLRAVDPTPGSGGTREWPDHEVVVASLMLRLLRAGLRLDVAARVARTQSYDLDGRVELRGGVRLDLDPSAVEAESARGARILTG